MQKDELQNIIRGKSGISQKTLVQTIANYLRRSEGASPMAKENKQYKQEETEKLIEYCTQKSVGLNIFSKHYISVAYKLNQ